GTKYLAAYVTNNGAINHAGTGDVSLSGGLTNVGTYDLQGDAGWGAPSLQEFLNQGVLRKSDGSGTATWGGFRNVGGTVDGHSGTLHLEFVGESTGLAVNVDTDATVTLEDGYGGLSGTFIGTYSGTGGGKVRFESGLLRIGGGGATFNFPDGMFEWTGGVLST